MATITCARSDLWPVGTTVGAYPAGAKGDLGDGPRAAAIATAAVASNGTLTITNAGIASYTTYVLAAQVSGEWRYCRARSTLDVFDAGGAIGTGDTTDESDEIANASASAGEFRVGQRLAGAGIPPGTFIVDVDGGTLTLSDEATVTDTTVDLVAEGAFTWQARLRRRRHALGTA